MLESKKADQVSAVQLRYLMGTGKTKRVLVLLYSDKETGSKSTVLTSIDLDEFVQKIEGWLGRCGRNCGYSLLWPKSVLR